MIIHINTISRLFIINRRGFFTRQYPCNLQDIKKILTEELEPNDDFDIYEIVGVKPKKCSKKMLNNLFKKNNIDLKLS